MNSSKARLQRAALFLRCLPLAGALYQAWYALALKAFVGFVRLRLGSAVKSVYLRRGGGRGELVPGASDLDFFLVLDELPAETEMKFLKVFWAGYRRLRLVFPFFGEVLMGDQNELSNWLSTPSVRAFEAHFSWKHLWGANALPLTRSLEPDLRDLFSEALKCYAELLHATIKLQPEQLLQNMRAHNTGAVRLRHAAKAALDLFRLHASMNTVDETLWRSSRNGLTKKLPELYGQNLSELSNLLRLRGKLFTEPPFLVFSKLVHTSILCLHEMAEMLGTRPEACCEGEYQVGYGANSRSTPDSYSLSVRELFAERILIRHDSLLSGAVLSEATAGIYFVLKSPPTLEETRALLLDLRDVSFSFDRLSVAMPLTKTTFAELERTSMLDTPFHSFAGHREISFAEGMLSTKVYALPKVRLPLSILRKTFAELSFALRLQPQELNHFLEKMVTLVLGLRLAADFREVNTDFHKTLARYGERYPLRLEQLKAKINPFLALENESEEKVWSGIYSRLDELELEVPVPTGQLRAQLDTIRRRNRDLPLSPTLTSDLWINLTPFLRMEMNAMKERYFEQRPALRI